MNNHLISQANEKNSKLNNGGFNKWEEILAGEDLQIKLRKSEIVDVKFSVSSKVVRPTQILGIFKKKKKVTT